MEVSRDDRVSGPDGEEIGFQLITYTNPRGAAEGIGPITHGSAYHTDVMKTEALKQALDFTGLMWLSAALGGTRRNPAPRSAFFRFGRRPPMGAQSPTARTLESLQHPNQRRRNHSRLSAFQLDRSRHLALHPPREYSDSAALLRRQASGG